MKNFKIDILQTILAIGINAIIGFALFYFANSQYKIYLGVTTGILLGIIFFLMTGIHYNNDKININTKTISAVFFAILLIVNLLFMLFNFTLPVFFIINGIIFFVYLIIYANIRKALTN